MQAWREHIKTYERIGYIDGYDGLKITAQGPPHTFPGEICDILDRQQQPVAKAEVLGFDRENVCLMALDDTCIQQGYSLRATDTVLQIPVGLSLQGRIVNALAKPLDNQGCLQQVQAVSSLAKKINPLHRKSITECMVTGVHALDGLLPLGKGQRIGIFAGSGVGKSRLMGMMAEHMDCDVSVIALIGERGREVGDFIHNHLSTEARAKSVLVVACSDESPLLRRQAAFTATTIAEYFASQGKQVVLFMDSITRFAHAQREIGLRLQEPPTARGYTPSVFAKLPPLIERTGNFMNQGSITGIYTVLVDGDDFNEPIADTLRSLLDGHIVLSRDLAHQGHYPAIHILQSVSRLTSQLFSLEEQTLVQSIRASLALYAKNKDLIELGAYQAGSHAEVDKAIAEQEIINKLLRQDSPQIPLNKEAIFNQFKEILSCKK